jgi:hypothetical protein
MGISDLDLNTESRNEVAVEREISIPAKCSAVPDLFPVLVWRVLLAAKVCNGA